MDANDLEYIEHVQTFMGHLYSFSLISEVVNAAGNFVIYCVMNREFREALGELCFIIPFRKPSSVIYGTSVGMSRA